MGELQGEVAPGYAEGYFSNICILPGSASTYMTINIRGHCDGSNESIATFVQGFRASNNTIFVPGGTASLICNHVKFNASNFMSGRGPTKEWNASAGYDPTSRVSGDVPSAGAIVAMAKRLLG